MNNGVTAVTMDNFSAVLAQIDWSVRNGRLKLSQAPLDALRTIPREPDPEALKLLEEWVSRHLLRGTRLKIFSEIGHSPPEETKPPEPYALSPETGARLDAWRRSEFGAEGGSLDRAVERLLEGNGRVLPEDAFRLLDAFRRRNDLASPAAALRALVDQVERGAPEAVVTENIGESTDLEEVAGEMPAAAGAMPGLRQEVQALLADLKNEA